jgi:hypothetical protein
MYLTPAERPSVGDVPAVYTSYDWLDYITRNGFAQIYNQEHLETIQQPLTR